MSCKTCEDCEVKSNNYDVHAIFKNSWMGDPRYKHEHFNRVQIWVMITGDGDGSNKHLEAQERRYLCLNRFCHKPTMITDWQFDLN